VVSLSVRLFLSTIYVTQGHTTNKSKKIRRCSSQPTLQVKRKQQSVPAPFPLRPSTFFMSSYQSVEKLNPNLHILLNLSTKILDDCIIVYLRHCETISRQARSHSRAIPRYAMYHRVLISKLSPIQHPLHIYHYPGKTKSIEDI
jgi:hypothetical protein